MEGLREKIEGLDNVLREFDAWLSFRGEFSEVQRALRDAFGINTDVDGVPCSWAIRDVLALLPASVPVPDTEKAVKDLAEDDFQIWCLECRELGPGEHEFVLVDAVREALGSVPVPEGDEPRQDRTLRMTLIWVAQELESIERAGGFADGERGDAERAEARRRVARVHEVLDLEPDAPLASSPVLEEPEGKASAHIRELVGFVKSVIADAEYDIGTDSFSAQTGFAAFYGRQLLEAVEALDESPAPSPVPEEPGEEVSWWAYDADYLEEGARVWGKTESAAARAWVERRGSEEGDEIRVRRMLPSVDYVVNSEGGVDRTPAPVPVEEPAWEISLDTVVRHKDDPDAIYRVTRGPDDASGMDVPRWRLTSKHTGGHRWVSVPGLQTLWEPVEEPECKRCGGMGMAAVALDEDHSMALDCPECSFPPTPEIKVGQRATHSSGRQREISAVENDAVTLYSPITGGNTRVPLAEFRAEYTVSDPAPSLNPEGLAKLDAEVSTLRAKAKDDRLGLLRDLHMRDALLLEQAREWLVSTPSEEQG